MMEALRSDGNLIGELTAVLLLAVPWALALLGMRRGYRRRRAIDEAGIGPLPPATAPDRAPDGTALYTGTTTAGDRIRKVAAHGLFGRGPADWWREPDALVFQRHRGPVVRITHVEAAGATGMHAGRVVAPGRIAVVRWRLGSAALDSGFAFDHAQDAQAFIETITKPTNTTSHA